MTLNVKCKLRIVPFLFISLFLPLFNAFPIFRQVQDLEDAQIKRVVISSLEPTLIYAASNNSLYKSDNRGRTFKKTSVFKDEKIKHIFFDRYLADTLYIATTRHLYRFRDKLEKLFTVVEEEELINTAAIHKGVLYIGTSSNLYFASQDILNWQRMNGLGGFSIYYLENADKNLYLATSRGVYLIKGKQRKERLFPLRDSEEEESRLVPNIIKVDIFNNKRIWLGTTKGLFISQNKGKKWNKFYAGGIDNLSIVSLEQTGLEKNTLYLSTPKGLFKLNVKDKSSKQIYEGLPTAVINWIAFSPKGEMYLATAKGLFKNDYFSSSSKSKLEEIRQKEPSIREIQRAALHYNEVEPEKIQKWRKELKYRALFPNFNLDYDKTINYDSGSDKYYVGPRDWGFSFSWDIGNLIWNFYQDDVDTRSRLNTQLRLDILDEINRVYFERLRLKNEILSSSLPQEELFQKQLRLEELTAIIDGYTGGYFSRRQKEFNEQQ